MNRMGKVARKSTRPGRERATKLSLPRRDLEADTKPAEQRHDPATPRGWLDTEISVSRRPTAPKMTTRVGRVCMQFGVDPQPQAFQIVSQLKLRFEPGSIILITGASGSGKSTILRAIEQKFPLAHSVHRAGLAPDKSIVDAVGPHLGFAETLRLLTCCGLGEPRLWIRTFCELSEGEQFRARLAKCLALQKGAKHNTLLLCDEFCAVLHRRAARAVAYNLRKLATSLRVAIVVASSNNDFQTDLQPDQRVELCSGGFADITRHRPVRRPISLRRSLVIEPGRKRDYLEFAPMHYRRTDELGFVDRVFVLRERSGGEKLAIVVYSHPPLELHLRNRVLDGRFKRNAGLLNREMRILRRLVVHPDVRGCGLGHYLVRKTLPMVGVPFVECLASMGSVNPVFARAGMTCVGECPMPAHRAKLLRDLQALGAEPFAPDFVNQVCRRPRVRKIVALLVQRWYQATTGAGDQRVAKQSPQFLAQTFRGLVATRPVYYLWQRKE